MGITICKNDLNENERDIKLPMSLNLANLIFHGQNSGWRKLSHIAIFRTPSVISRMSASYLFLHIVLNHHRVLFSVWMLGVKNLRRTLSFALMAHSASVYLGYSRMLSSHLQLCLPLALFFPPPFLLYGLQSFDTANYFVSFIFISLRSSGSTWSCSNICTLCSFHSPWYTACFPVEPYCCCFYLSLWPFLFYLRVQSSAP